MVIYLLSFNKQLELVAIIQYDRSYDVEEQFSKSELPDVFTFRKKKEVNSISVGGLNSGRTMNALEYVMHNNVEGQTTIINFDDYQLSFIDDLNKKTCKVMKFTR